MFWSPYKSIPAKLEKVIDETSNIKTFVLRPESKFRFATGQFIELSIPGVGEAPFTPSSSPYETDTIDVTIMKAGNLTGQLHALKGGETLGIRGPYGTGYPIEKFYGKEVLILGGGVGMAPLRSLLLTLIAQKEKFKRIILCYGSKSPEDVVYKHQFTEWQKIKELEIMRSVDKCPIGQWDETVGLVTCLLDQVKVDLKNTVSIVCGPPIMMKFGSRKLLDIGYTHSNIYLSMEGNMSCGIGKCGHCQIGHNFICKDGPVFTYEQLKHIPDPFI
ncbi:MAG TPA: oxidoreductase [Elusimicrobia bacterium]|nr:MAG: oxidoreductase [Elusimicrobia bacterium RIFOXYA12_FULL_49_49]OGS10193.1 MAG: oxidoreductase [Elusimicrobia bacterium RIFOXYA1_FULL_47_7]OGS11813.1 MAG: oxidoreductase [Elusimicrobia bacterium RIFOXYB1_FULL_48_9]OGS15997.1 MAG: oxidoreductase [Elusimicrobia bacterium RIFOXYA2_FULL_47_53]OGS26323.1 MAG: oxidoreductase [Elusimicrobia bacterium RIFOXYB12_FULL_50_12]OGS29165.1 MAG: oxidoreductase [Elusimicrobia bacterium RIFOXYB2_FULL_46_23]HBU69364.1 oxidoreductase [Elusimicrobiota bacter